MKKHDGILMEDAAEQLGTTTPKLFERLRTAKAFNGKLPRLQYTENGYFKIDQRSFTLRGTKIQKHYSVALVTGTGLAYLRDLLDGVAQKGPMAHRKQQRLHRMQSTCHEPATVHSFRAETERQKLLRLAAEL